MRYVIIKEGLDSVWYRSGNFTKGKKYKVHINSDGEAEVKTNIGNMYITLDNFLEVTKIYLGGE